MLFGATDSFGRIAGGIEYNAIFFALTDLRLSRCFHLVLARVPWPHVRQHSIICSERSSWQVNRAILRCLCKCTTQRFNLTDLLTCAQLHSMVASQIAPILACLALQCGTTHVTYSSLYLRVCLELQCRSSSRKMPSCCHLMVILLPRSLWTSLAWCAWSCSMAVRLYRLTPSYPQQRIAGW